eukprot:6464299-Amphidinium_carterae.2
MPFRLGPRFALALASAGSALAAAAHGLALAGTASGHGCWQGSVAGCSGAVAMFCMGQPVASHGISQQFLH